MTVRGVKLVALLAGALLVGTVAVPASAQADSATGTLSGQFLFIKAGHYPSRVEIQSATFGGTPTEVVPDLDGNWSVDLPGGSYRVKYSYLAHRDYTPPRYWHNGDFILDPDRQTPPVYTVSNGAATVSETVSVKAPGYGAPYGIVESAAPQSDGTVIVTGWAMDPDKAFAAVRVKTVVDDVESATSARAHQAGAQHSGHHFRLTTTALSAGVHTVCVAAYGLLRGGDAAVGCREVTIV